MIRTIRKIEFNIGEFSQGNKFYKIDNFNKKLSFGNK
jgi:hypothetical protein